MLKEERTDHVKIFKLKRRSILVDLSFIQCSCDKFVDSTIELTSDLGSDDYAFWTFTSFDVFDFPFKYTKFSNLSLKNSKNELLL